MATRDDEALYRATSQMAYIDLAETGQAYHHGRMAPVFNVTLTERGKEISRTCGTPSKSTTFYVPTATRRYTSGAFLKQEPGGRTVYEVDFTWVPTPIGDQVSHVLTGAMAIKAGPARAKVFMKKLRAGSDTGPNGWTVDAIDDRIRPNER